MRVFDVYLEVRVHEYSIRKAVKHTLPVLVVLKGGAEQAIKKAMRFAFKREWDGKPLSAELLSVKHIGDADVHP